MPEIAGYADTISVKGQYYKLASSPKPVVYTGDISAISDDLLSRAMFVTRNATNSASLPNSFGTNILITTVEYGSGNYLQTAYLVQTGYECYEYRRIYSSGNWTAWIGVDSAIAAASSAANSAKETADKAATDAGTAISNAASLKTTVDSLSSTSASSFSDIFSRLGTLENKVVTNDISSSYTVTKTKGPWNFSEVKAYRTGNTIQMNILLRGNGSSVGNNSNGFEGTITTGPRPMILTRFLAMIQGSSIVGYFDPSNNSIIIRNTGSPATLSSSSTLTCGTTFVVNG